MVRLVRLPMWTVHGVDDKAALQQLGVTLGLHWQLVANLRQLCGFDVVGKGRTARHTTSGWYCFDEVQWLFNADYAAPSWAAPLCCSCRSQRPTFPASVVHG